MQVALPPMCGGEHVRKDDGHGRAEAPHNASRRILRTRPKRTRQPLGNTHRITEICGQVEETRSPLGLLA